MTHKDAFYYAAHPYEAYSKGYNVLIGDASIQGEAYQAYTYFFPAEVISFYQTLGDFYDVLIKDHNVPMINKRHKSYTDVFDIAIHFLAKIQRHLENNSTFLMGSKEKPVAFAYIGPVSHYAIALNTYETIWEIIGEYTAKYETAQRAVPLVCYHKHQRKEYLDKLLLPKTPETHQFNSNRILAGALAFMYDVIVNCGPETHQICELFTNDYRIQGNNVDQSILSKARLAAFHTQPAPRKIIQADNTFRDYGRGATGLSASSQAYSYQRNIPKPAPPVPKFVKVKITECHGDLQQGTAVFSFLPTASEIAQAHQDNERKKQRFYERVYGEGYGNLWNDWD